jgi:hypothetical protein
MFHSCDIELYCFARSMLIFQTNVFGNFPVWYLKMLFCAIRYLRNVNVMYFVVNIPGIVATVGKRARSLFWICIVIVHDSAVEIEATFKIVASRVVTWR